MSESNSYNSTKIRYIHWDSESLPPFDFLRGNFFNVNCKSALLRIHSDTRSNTSMQVLGIRLLAILIDNQVDKRRILGTRTLKSIQDRNSPVPSKLIP